MLQTSFGFWVDLLHTHSCNSCSPQLLDVSSSLDKTRPILNESALCFWHQQQSTTRSTWCQAETHFKWRLLHRCYQFWFLCCVCPADLYIYNTMRCKRWTLLTTLGIQVVNNCYWSLFDRIRDMSVLPYLNLKKWQIILTIVFQPMGYKKSAPGNTMNTE